MDDQRRRRIVRAICLAGVPLLLVAGIAAAAIVGGDDDDATPVEAGVGATSTSTPGPTTTVAPSGPTTTAAPTTTVATTPTTIRPGASVTTTTPPSKASARVLVKFADGSDVRLRNGSLVSLAGKDMTPLNQVLQRYPGAGVERLFTRPEADLAREKAEVEALTGKPQPDLNLWYVMTPADASKVDALIADLKRLVIVEQANRDPGAVPLPAPAP